MSNPCRDNIWGMEVVYCTALSTEPSSNNCSVEGTCTPLCSGNFCMISVFFYFFNKKCICCLCNRHFDIFYDVLQFCIPFPKFEIYHKLHLPSNNATSILSLSWKIKKPASWGQNTVEWPLIQTNWQVFSYTIHIAILVRLVAHPKME